MCSSSKTTHNQGESNPNTNTKRTLRLDTIDLREEHETSRQII